MTATIPSEDFFQRLEHERTRALVVGDMEVVERLHAPDYELVTPAGRIFSRENYLSAVASEPFYSAWKHGPMRVRISERMAVIRYRAELHFVSGGVVDCWHTDIYELRHGSWQAVWSQATGVKPLEGRHSRHSKEA